MSKEEEKYKNQQQTDDYPFDYSLAEPTDKQKVEEMRVNPYEDTYANYMYGQTEQQQIPREQTQESAVPNPVPDKMPYVDIQQPNNFHISEDARQAGQKMTGKFIAPNTNPTTFNELMENWRARDEYDEARYNQKEKWRKISQAIIGAGELVARGLTGASGEAVTPKYMAEHGAQALDELRNLRARNRDRFNTAYAHLIQQQQDELARQRLKAQEAQNRQAMDIKKLELGLRKQGLDNTAAHNKAVEKYYENKYETDKQRNAILEANGKSQRAVNASTIAKNNAQTAKTKTENKENVSFGNKEYLVPKGTDYGSIFRQVRKRLIDLDVKSLDPTNKNDKAKIDVREKILKARTDQYSAHTPNDFKFLIDDVARVMPDLVDDVIRSMQGVKPVSGNGTTTTSKLNFNLK